MTHIPVGLLLVIQGSCHSLYKESNEIKQYTCTVGEQPYYLTLRDKLNKFSTPDKGLKSTHEEENTYVALSRLRFNP